MNQSEKQSSKKVASRFDLHPAYRKSSRRIVDLPPISPDEFRNWLEKHDVSLYQISRILDCSWQKIKSVMNGEPSSCKKNRDGTLRIPNSVTLAMICIENGILLEEIDPKYGAI